MQSHWKRPEYVPFPSIWSRFDGRKKINGQIPKFWIQDIPEDMFDDAVHVMCSNYMYEEPLCRYSQLAQDPVSVGEVQETWRQLLEDRVGLVCLMENPDISKKPIIAGLNMTYIGLKDETIPTFHGKKWTKIVNAAMFLCHQRDIFEQLGITTYMGAFGLSVLPEFRGQGIGEELLRARSALGRAVGLKATLTLFTATASQKLAERVGFQDIIEMTYEELEAKNPEFKFPGISEHTKTVRYMYQLF